MKRSGNPSGRSIRCISPSSWRNRPDMPAPGLRFPFGIFWRFTEIRSIGWKRICAEKGRTAKQPAVPESPGTAGFFRGIRQDSGRVSAGRQIGRTRPVDEMLRGVDEQIAVCIGSYSLSCDLTDIVERIDFFSDIIQIIHAGIVDGFVSGFILFDLCQVIIQFGAAVNIHAIPVDQLGIA